MLRNLLFSTAFLPGSQFLALATIPNNVEGWYSESNSLTCDYPQTYVSTSLSSGVYGRCCTGRTSGSYACPTGQICHVMAIYESSTTGQAALDHFCGDADSKKTTELFRTTDAPTATPGFATVVPRAPQTIPFGIPTSLSSNNDDDSKGSGSKAWIAGAVLGPVVGCALLGAGAFWFIRRRRASKLSNDSESELYQGSQKAYELDSSCEAPVPAPIVEAPASAPIAEAPTPSTEVSIPSPIAELPAPTK
ncbi:hypothetical protein N7478_013141 [Penicillium angulare]|uniref:uncharacterized protein n=1 Tax=Penicillium angulare TaxID=116970 RepID=UPI002541F3A9|nr:uncharacterized protein N7478_013141 [Penicillium angulare]KAJ5257037.1 hypothetical protein N7478_013141 [Penicillium angulare]